MLKLRNCWSLWFGDSDSASSKTVSIVLAFLEGRETEKSLKGLCGAAAAEAKSWSCRILDLKEPSPESSLERDSFCLVNEEINENGDTAGLDGEDFSS